ncbi:MAG: LTA synthase family protein [Lachnospirales bacterium]
MRFLEILSKYKFYIHFFIFSMISVFFIEFSYYYFSLPYTFNWIVKHLYLFFISIFIVMSFMVFIFSLSRHKLISVFLPVVVAVGYGIGMYLKLVYRGVPVLPYEISMAFNLKELLNFINEEQRIYVLGALFIFIIAFTLILKFAKRQELSKNFRIVNGLISFYIIVLLVEYNLVNSAFFAVLNIVFLSLIAAMICIVYKSKYKFIGVFILCLVSIPFWNKNIIKSLLINHLEYPGGHFAYYNYDTDGVIPAFLSYANIDTVTKPFHYSKEAVEKVFSKYSKISVEKNQIRTDIKDMAPNIIYIMSESFSDPKNVDNIKLNINPIVNYDELSKKYSNGTTVANGYGGGTNISEFEALTGISSQLLNSLMVFNNVSGRSNLPSIASFLKNQSYETAALHFNNPAIYGRNKGYKNIGFDYYYNNDDGLNSEYYKRTKWPNDESNYKQVIKILEAYGNPAFVHNVTIQNHGPYSVGISGNEYDVENLANTKKEVEAELYYNMISHSDEVLKDFFKELDEFPEPTIVVFWGDHLPYFYKNPDFGDDIMDKFETPFMIYSNFSQNSPKDFGDVSMNYLPNIMFDEFNFKKSPYYYLLGDVEKISNVTHYMYNVVEPTNIFAKYKNGEVIEEEAQQIFDDYQMILYDIMEGKNYSVDMGFFDVVK